MVSSRSSRKWDVYSFAILASVLLTGKQPYSGLAPEQVYVSVCLHGTRPKLPEDLPEFQQKVLKECWSSEPSDRPNFSEISVRLQGQEMPPTTSIDSASEIQSQKPPEKIKKYTNVTSQDGTLVFRSESRGILSTTSSHGSDGTVGTPQHRALV